MHNNIFYLPLSSNLFSTYILYPSNSSSCPIFSPLRIFLISNLIFYSTIFYPLFSLFLFHSIPIISVLLSSPLIHFLHQLHDPFCISNQCHLPNRNQDVADELQQQAPTDPINFLFYNEGSTFSILAIIWMSTSL